MKIAFGYKAGSGKDTCVDYLIKKHGGKKIAFSEPLYDILNYAQNICGFEHTKDRKFLQFIGTEWGRETNPNIWVELALKKCCNTSNNFYCSDVRFLNEFEALRNNGWTLIKLVRDEDILRIGNGNTNHVSETQLDLLPDGKWDYIIDNNGTLEDLYVKLDKIVSYNISYVNSIALSQIANTYF